ncbi:rhomboid family intramembrane serine protease [Nostoc sp. FACHB-110]|uniref:rhomboid family intramembrane serine protease n=1 Tax=Nostoc sp. FACHB-110 TaxID=2692834 RepID=UPI001688559A|nr:rhomboid family intramembrane serine protease [Nostoc sp. FACHB-110]MBD2436595.1 rhomboid family intramembrane serine protease [Nostoc sp. FACHB-110]
MIPISDRRPNRHQPIVNYWLIGINIAVFFWELQLESTGQLSGFVNSWGIIPAHINEAIQAIFSNSAAWLVLIGHCLRLISALFIHASFSQILSNLIFLWVFGKSLENCLGHRRYLILYLIAGICTGIMQILAEPNLIVPLIGANSAIAAILGAYYFNFPQAKIYTVLPLLLIYIPAEIPVIFYLVWWFVQQFFYGIGSLNIQPSGANALGLAYWLQIIGGLIGIAYIKSLK